eukprot:915039-Alexandrium_andersonii.AAC.1
MRLIPKSHALPATLGYEPEQAVPGFSLKWALYTRVPWHAACAISTRAAPTRAVSYTHLTLPTICSV